MAEGKDTNTAVVPQQMLQNKATQTLYKSQAEIAMYLEIGYLAVSNFPELSGEIRLTAHSARTLHKMTAGLMKKYYGSAVHIIETMIPLIIDAVELQDTDIIKEAYSQIIKLALDMKKEAEDTQERCYSVQTDIQKNITSCRKTEEQQEKDKKKRDNDLELEKLRERETEREQQRIQKEKEERETKVQKYKEQIEESLEQSDKAKKEAIDARGDLVSEIMTIPDALTASATTPELVASAAKAVVGVGAKLYGMFAAADKSKDLKEITDEQKRRLDEETKQLKEAEQQERQARGEALEIMLKIKQLTMEETASVGNIESLKEAVTVLHNVDRQLSQIANFWDDIVVVVSYMSNQNKAGEVYLAKIDKPAHAQRFKASIEKAEKSWMIFRDICGDYIAVCDKSPQFSIDKLYDFLSKPVDYMSKEAKTDRKTVLFGEIENSIKAITE